MTPDITPFVPRRRLKNGHVMTVYCWAAPRRFRLPSPEPRLFHVTPDTQVLAHCYWQHDRSRPTLLALHGLEGSSTAHYMLGLADKALRVGFNAVLLNQRNCGDTEHLGPGLYHSGLVEDAAFVVRRLAETDGVNRVVAAGYSLGGNLALRLAGVTTPETLPQLKGVCAVSPVVELAECISALERRANVIYHWNFVRHLKDRMRRKNRHFPGRFDVSHLGDIRSIRHFDEVYTAPYFGFGTSTNYYYQASAMRVVEHIQVPALVISSADDPFVPKELFDHPRLRENPNITVVLTQHGGHCGFVEARHDQTDDGYWAERTIVEFAREVFDRDQRL